MAIEAHEANARISSCGIREDGSPRASDGALGNRSVVDPEDQQRQEMLTDGVNRVRLGAAASWRRDRARRAER